MSRVRRVAALDGERSFTIETVPRVGYRLRPRTEESDVSDVSVPAMPTVAPASAAPPSPPLEAAEVLPARPDRRLVLGGLAGGVALITVGATIATRFWPGAAERPRIAVLPFDALGQAERSLADGLADALITALSAVPQVDVVARTSTFALRGAEKARAVELLGATYLIDGAVSSIGGELAASIDLIDAQLQSTVWSQRYPIGSDTIAALRARIVRDTGTMLNLSTDRTAAAISPADFRTFLQAQGALLRDKPALAEALPALSAVTSRAPSFAPGWTALAAARLMSQKPLDPSAPVTPARAQARAAARRAIAVAPASAAAHALLAAASERQAHWGAVAALLDRAVALEPNNAQVLYRAGAFHADTGANGRAIDLLQRAWRVDPLNADAAFLLLRVLQAAGRQEELDAFLANARQVWRNDLGIWRFAACRAVWLRRFDEAQRLAESPPEHAGEEAAYFVDLIDCARDPASPRVVRFLAPLKGPVPKFWPISIFALSMIERPDDCLALIRRIFLSPEGRAQAPCWVLLQAILQPHWDDPRFRAVLRELGLFDYWRSARMDPLGQNRRAH